MLELALQDGWKVVADTVTGPVTLIRFLHHDATPSAARFDVDKCWFIDSTPVSVSDEARQQLAEALRSDV